MNSPSIPMQLFVISGPDTPRTIPLIADGLVRVGRSSECEAQLADPTASRVHFELRMQDSRVWLRDADSRFGTFVNDIRTRDCELRPGDVIRAGETTFRVDDHSFENRQTIVPVSQGHSAPADQSPHATVDQNPRQLLGQRFLQYEVQASLTKTNRGIVFRARDVQRNTDVALKVFTPAKMNATSSARFLRAARSMMQLTHPHLVQVYAAGQDGGFCWMVSELIEGESAADMILRIGIAGMLDWRHTLRLGIQVADALTFAGQQQLVHRNITPRSILVRRSDNCVKLAGLGLAKSLDEEAAQGRITQAGEIVGDLPYCSPEQASGADVDERSDIYNLGATLYALLTGQPPCQGRTVVETLDRIQHVTPEAPRKVHLSVPEMLEGTVYRMLAKRPEQRFKSAVDLLLDLQRIARYTGL